MPVRVRVRLRSLRSGEEVTVPALLSTGFTSDELDIHVPQDVARELGVVASTGELLVSGN